MAKMLFRHTNMAEWVGTRPAHNGVQIVDQDLQSGTGAIAMYTVPLGKVLHLTFLSIAASLSADAAARGRIIITTEVPATYLVPLVCQFEKAGQLMDHVSFWPPLELPAGYVITINVVGANITCYVAMSGWVEDA